LFTKYALQPRPCSQCSNTVMPEWFGGERLAPRHWWQSMRRIRFLLMGWLPASSCAAHLPTDERAAHPNPGASTPASPQLRVREESARRWGIPGGIQSHAHALPAWTVPGAGAHERHGRNFLMFACLVFAPGQCLSFQTSTFLRGI
jgi:hypothetical protein